VSRAKREVTAFAPATVANVAVGFDVLGFAFGELGDRVTVEIDEDADPEHPVVLDAVACAEFEGDQTLPSGAKANTATRALVAMVEDLGLGHGFRVRLEKGIPLGSGMGGSAASAVGAVVAAEALLDDDLSRSQLLRYALDGEAAATGSVEAHGIEAHGIEAHGGGAHGDNVAPCLFGGLCGYLPGEPAEVLQIPVPSGLSCVLVRPRLRQDTRAQRALLDANVSTTSFVEQSAHLTGFLAACYRDDVELLRRSMRDVVIGPQRLASIPGAAAALEAARDAGALGCSVAGSGPSLFAWVVGGTDPAGVRDAICETLARHELQTDAWVGPIAPDGARVLEGA
jgi:homoserine kinase